eukprot:10535-Heterococcus_DN1.PRE.1
MASEPELSAWVLAEDGWNHIDGFASEHSSDLDEDENSSVKSWVSDDDQCEREIKTPCITACSARDHAGRCHSAAAQACRGGDCAALVRSLCAAL